MRENEKLSAIKAFSSALEARDPYTEGHSLRVSRYAVEIGKEMKLTESTIRNLEMSSLLHNIGKIAVPDEILLKNGKLTEDEREKMQKHPVESARILKDFHSLGTIAPFALYHHERFDGNGYPDGLLKEEIPFEAQIISVPDAFDAMTSTRAYRKAMELETALHEIRSNSGVQWRSNVVSAFLRCIEKKLITITT